MRNKRIVAGVAITIAFFGFLWWSTLAAQRTECRVCVSYGGGRNCATASADSIKAAARSAHSTACGTLAHGMNDAIACQNTPALTEECKTR
jgi:hypothetical protein